MCASVDPGTSTEKAQGSSSLKDEVTTPYHFNFIFVPRRTSNWRKIRFGEVAVLKQISALYRKNL
jgi:hypothetical protein